MPTDFAELYSRLLKDVFTEQARKQVAEGADSLTCADAYAEQGKPEFALAYLLLIDLPDDVKRDIFARAYERRAILSEEKAESFDRQFNRPFPLIKLEAQKDRTAAQQIRQGKRVRREAKPLRVN
ncbi:MAG: hypothetical protein NVS4B7_18070 [Ktedonobacteraceae bacterium]